MNTECSRHSQSGNGGNKTFTFCQNGKCCSTGSLPAKKEEFFASYFYCRENKFKANELGHCGKFEFDFDNVEGNVTYFSAIDGWTPSEIELYIGNGTRILEGYHNIFRCSFEKRIDVNNRNEPSSLDFHCKPRKCLFPDCEGKVSFSNFINMDKEFRREGWTETAIILCKLNKSL